MNFGAELGSKIWGSARLKSGACLGFLAQSSFAISVSKLTLLRL